MLEKNRKFSYKIELLDKIETICPKTQILDKYLPRKSIMNLPKKKTKKTEHDKWLLRRTLCEWRGEKKENNNIPD